MQHTCRASLYVRRRKRYGGTGREKDRGLSVVSKGKEPLPYELYLPLPSPFLRLARRLCKAVIFARWKVFVEGYLGVKCGF